MTQEELAAFGLRVTHLEFGSDQLAIDHTGGCYELYSEDGVYWITYHKRWERAGEGSVLGDNSKNEAEAKSAAELHHATSIAAMIERVAL